MPREAELKKTLARRKTAARALEQCGFLVRFYDNLQPAAIVKPSIPE